jgi:hypothetical protein
MRIKYLNLMGNELTDDVCFALKDILNNNIIKNLKLYRKNLL